MDEDTIQDLKQFIATTVSQATANMVTKDDLAVTNKKLDDGFAGIGEALENSNESTDTQLKDHERRLVRLENKAA